MIYREKMLGMKNHFNVSDSIEIREVNIVGVACITINFIWQQFDIFRLLTAKNCMHLA